MLFSSVYRLHLKRTLLTQDTNTFAKVDSLQIAQNPEIPYEQTEEHTVDCPDCFENCDLIISEMGAHSFVG